MPDEVVLVDEQDAPIGTADKQEAHRSGALHRAFSVFVFDGAGRLLLQRRAADKYHSGGLWANTCCSHPRPGEDVADAAHRRLREEMGFDCELSPAGSFVYRASLGNGLTEHEFDHLLVGRFDGEPRPDPAEVGAWRVVRVPELRRDMAARPDRYAAWLSPALARLAEQGLLPDAG
jgi:isopentenyl-diphosphate delta-isomerase